MKIYWLVEPKLGAVQGSGTPEGRLYFHKIWEIVPAGREEEVPTPVTVADTSTE